MALDYLSFGIDPYGPLSSGTDYLSLTRDPSRPPAPESEEEDDGLLNPAAEFSRGLYHSLSAGNLEMVGGAMEAAGHLGGGDIASSMGGKLQEWSRSASRLVDPPVSWDEANGVLGTVSWFAGQTGSALGSMAPTMAAGAAGGAIGTVVGGPPGGAVA